MNVVSVMAKNTELLCVRVCVHTHTTGRNMLDTDFGSLIVVPA